MSAPTAATPKSAAAHAPDELHFVTLDAAGAIAYFRSASQHKAGAHNVTALDLDTRETFCFCRGAEFGHICWHQVHAAAAWRKVAYRVRCARMDRPTLEAHGHSLAKYVMQAEAAHQPYIAAQLRERLDTARQVWRERMTKVIPFSYPFDAAPLLAA
jgi:hypothetical protein